MHGRPVAAESQPLAPARRSDDPKASETRRLANVEASLREAIPVIEVGLNEALCTGST